LSVSAESLCLSPIFAMMASRFCETLGFEGEYEYGL
jgi:hypothetical protein